MHKGIRKKQLCKGIADTGDCGIKYWQKWEQGQGGATSPDEPQLNPIGFCEGIISSVVGFRSVPVEVTLPRKSYVGDRLHEIIRKKTGKEIPCEDCIKAIMHLNSLTVEECAAEPKHGEIIDDVASRSIAQAPHVWQKAILLADNAVAGGKGAKWVIGSWVDEAIRTGEMDLPIPEIELQERTVAALSKKRLIVCNGCVHNNEGACLKSPRSIGALVSNPAASCPVGNWDVFVSSLKKTCCGS